MAREGGVVLQEHNPLWAEAFRMERERLALALPFLEFHHVGSTAVPALCAKPILDILAVAPDLDQLDIHRLAFEKLGYEYKGEFGISGRRYCVLYDAAKEIGFVQLHAFARGSEEVARHLLFRDYLRAFPAVAEEYGSLKRALLAAGHARSVYTQAKAPFIARVLADAARWRALG